MTWMLQIQLNDQSINQKKVPFLYFNLVEFFYVDMNQIQINKSHNFN